MTPPITGRCLCRAVAWAADAAPLWQSHCHCDSCRRATGSAFASFVGMVDGHWCRTGQTPVRFRSSPGVARYFCPACGTPLAYRSSTSPAEVHFHAGTLDRPQDFAPESHDHADERLSWLRLADGLPDR